MFCSPCVWGKRNRTSSLVSVTPSESSNKTMPDGQTKSTTLIPSGEKSPGSTPADEISTASELSLSPVTDEQMLPGRSERLTLLTSVLTEVSGKESLQSSTRPTAQAERKNAKLNGQEQKTAAKKTTTTSNMPDMKKAKTKIDSVKQSFKLPITKHISLKNTAMSKAKEEKKTRMLQNQERKEDRKQTTPFYRRWKKENPRQDMKELNFSSDMRKKKSVKDPYTFSLNIMMLGKNRKSTTPTPSNGKRPASALPDKKCPASSVGKSPTPSLTKGNTKRPVSAPSVENSTTDDRLHDFENLLLMNASLQCQLSDEDCCEELLDLPELFHLPDNSSENIEDTFPGLPNFGNSCYINASLQCLFTAEAFCKDLSYLLDNSGQNIEDTFLICFVELSRLRRGFEICGDKDSFLLALIDSAADLNPEFTIYEQNDPHEFLCHCLTQMEETGRWQGWQEDVNTRCPVRTNFSFKMKNTITCSSCGSQQSDSKVNVFNYMFVPLVHNSVDQCLNDRLNKTTKLESKCKVCGGEFASSRWTFYTLPRFLILQLNRFKATEHYSVKLKTPVNIQPELQINYSPQTDMSSTENNAAEARETGRNELGELSPTYQLISVLSHFGVSPKYGHYVTDCFSHKYHEWMTYDDELVTPTTETDVLQMRSSDAYVLLYEIVNTIKIQ